MARRNMRVWNGLDRDGVKRAMVLIAVVTPVVAMGLPSTSPGAITGVTLHSVSSVYSNRTGEKTLDGSGLLGVDHGSAPSDMWLTNVNLASNDPWIVYDLGTSHDLASLRVWNYNEITFPLRGVKDVEILTAQSATNPVWVSRGTYAFTGGVSSALASQKITFASPLTDVRLVKLDVATNQAGRTYPAGGQPDYNAVTGISEIRFETFSPGGGPVAFSGGSYQSQQDSFEFSKSFDGAAVQNQGWAGRVAPVAPDTDYTPPNVGVYNAASSFGDADGMGMLFRFYQDSTYGNHNLGRFRISATTDAVPSIGGNWTVLSPLAAYSAGANGVVGVTDGFAADDATLTVQPDGSILASGNNAGKDTYWVTARTNLTGITALRLELLEDPSLPREGPGRATSDGNYILTEFTALATPIANAQGTPVVLQRATAEFSQANYEIGDTISTGSASSSRSAPH